MPLNAQKAPFNTLVPLYTEIPDKGFEYSGRHRGEAGESDAPAHHAVCLDRMIVSPSGYSLMTMRIVALEIVQLNPLQISLW
jgi:hypothetical protein